MVRIFRMYHVDNIAECVIKVIITAFERIKQLIADTPHQQSRMMFVFIDHLLKGLILPLYLTGIMIKAQWIRITKRQTNYNSQMVRFCGIQHLPKVDRIPYSYRIASHFVKGSQMGISTRAFY